MNVLAKLNEALCCLKLKLAPLAKAYMRQKEENEIEGLFYHMLVPQMSRREKSRIHGIMFSRFIDNPNCVSFAMGNLQLLGNIAPVDMWFLTYFVFVTCQRVRGDNLLQLGCVVRLFVSCLGLYTRVTTLGCLTIIKNKK
jgi:hypothetical protein